MCLYLISSKCQLLRYQVLFKFTSSWNEMKTQTDSHHKLEYEYVCIIKCRVEWNALKRKPAIFWNVTFLRLYNKHLTLNKFKYFTILLLIVSGRKERAYKQIHTHTHARDREKKIIFFNVPKKWGNKNLHNFCQNRLSRQRNFCNAPFGSNERSNTQAISI